MSSQPSSSSSSKKMPPTVQQHDHHPPWPWAETDEGPPLKRPSPVKAGAAAKRLKMGGEDVVVSKKVVVDGTSLNDKLVKGRWAVFFVFVSIYRKYSAGGFIFENL